MLAALMVLEAAHSFVSACPRTCMRALCRGLATGHLFVLRSTVRCVIRTTNGRAHHSYLVCSLLSARLLFLREPSHFLCSFSQMVCGQTPFYARGDDNDDTFAKVVDDKVKLTWPSDVHVSSECKSLVKGLLRRDPAKRLGVGDHGGTNIKRAPWFKDIDFAALRHSKPPIIPGVPRLPKRPVDDGSGRYSGDSGEADEKNDSEDEAETGMFPHFSSRRDLSKGPGWADGLWDPQQ